MKLALSAFVIAACWLVQTAVNQPTARRQPSLFVEALPDQIRARIQEKVRAAANVARTGRGAAAGTQFFMFLSKRWTQAYINPISVAFNGGSEALDAQIASVMSEWSKYGDAPFDFIDPSTHHYRQWSRTDTTFAADVRIAFDGIDGAGYWSLIGVDSSDPTIIAPNQASLELDGFATGLPPDWAAVVRHETGHALGLMHEHQSPAGGCDTEFRWQDDPGYVHTQDLYGQYTNDSSGRRPGIYTLLAGAPNYWSTATVDGNMRQLTVDSHNYNYGPFDPKSIMMYHFDASFFVSGGSSRCYSDENTVISSGDQAGIAKWYPEQSSPTFQELLKQQSAFQLLLKKLPLMQPVRIRK